MKENQLDVLENYAVFGKANDKATRTVTKYIRKTQESFEHGLLYVSLVLY